MGSIFYDDSSLLFNFTVLYCDPGGSFNWNLVGEFGPFLAITSQNSLAKLVYQLGHFAPKLFARVLNSTIIMGVAIFEHDFWWLSLFL